MTQLYSKDGKGVSMNYLAQFKEHIANHNYPKFLTLWEEYCLGDELDTKELAALFREIKRSEMRPHFGRHVIDILPLWEALPDSTEKEDLFRDIIDLQTSNSPDLALTVIDYLKSRYGEGDSFQAKLKLVGLKEGTDFTGAVSSFELLSHLAEGNFVFHTGGWGVGEILEVSFLREQVGIEFDYVPGKKELSFANACKVLIPLPKTHFLARRFGAPDELEALAKRDPIAVMHMLLKDLGPQTAADIKEEMYELVIPEGDWAKWWQATRSKIKKDTLIESPRTLKGAFRLRSAEISHETRLTEALSAKPDAKTLISMVYTFLRDFPTATHSSEFRTILIEKLREALATHELSDSEELQIHFFLSDLIEGGDYPAVGELVRRLSSLERIVRDIDITAFQKRLLMTIRAERSDWADIFLTLFLTTPHNSIREYALDQLLKEEKERLITALNRMLAKPLEAPHALIWYFQKAMRTNRLPYGDAAGRSRLFESLLILLHRIEQSGRNKELAKKITTLITADKYAHVRSVMESSTAEDAHEFLLLATKCLSFEDHDIKIFHSVAEVTHPSLSELSKKYEETEEEEVLWTTQEGYNSVQDRMKQIATVETVENAKEIEVARSHGDLRENAEFKAALERRSRLQNELKQLSDMIGKTRILTRDIVSTESVGVGTVVACKGDDGKITTFTLLGPWDADVEQGIISFQSKLAQSLAGCKVGDHVTIQQKEYTISGISNYFDRQ